MEIITILLDKDEQGKARVQIVASDGVEATDGAMACQRAVRSFEAALIEAEVQRRLEAAKAETEEGEA